jgi:Spy/CpxP family protein refolding chaperone
MSRKFGWSAAIILLGVLGGVSLVQGQEAGEPNNQKGRIQIQLAGPAIEMLNILHGEKFQKEFNLTEEQKSKLAAIEKDVQATIKKHLADAKPASREEVQRAIGEINGKVQEKLSAGIKQILQPPQMERLKEIRLQVMGARALLTPDIAKALNLTDQQKKQIRTLAEEGQKAVRELTGGQDLSPEERRAKAAENQEKIKKAIANFQEKALLVLTPQQREQFKKMSGKKVA